MDSSNKRIYVTNPIGPTTFSNFESLTLIDAGATNGFQIAGGDGIYSQVPTGIVVNIGGPGPRLCEQVSIIATSGQPLNVTAILYK
jgi:hypothetical protein